MPAISSVDGLVSELAFYVEFRNMSAHPWDLPFGRSTATFAGWSLFLQNTDTATTSTTENPKPKSLGLYLRAKSISTDLRSRLTTATCEVQYLGGLACPGEPHVTMDFLPLDYTTKSRGWGSLLNWDAMQRRHPKFGIDDGFRISMHITVGFEPQPGLSAPVLNFMDSFINIPNPNDLAIWAYSKRTADRRGARDMLPIYAKSIILQMHCEYFRTSEHLNNSFQPLGLILYLFDPTGVSRVPSKVAAAEKALCPVSQDFSPVLVCVPFFKSLRNRP